MRAHDRVFMTTVTVLMSVYNGRSYLAETVESVLSQDYCDFEFLIIDDASTDDTVRLIESYRDSRIRLLQNDRNIGQAESLNRGLWEAKGKYIARLDHDDICLPSRLSRQVAYLEARPEVAAVSTWAYRIDSKGRQIGYHRSRLDNFGVFVGQLLVVQSTLIHPGVMYRKEVVAQLSGYDPSYAPAEDFELWTRMATCGHRAHIIPEELLLYRVHERQLSIVQKALQRKNASRAHQKLVEAFCESPRARKLGAMLRLDPEFFREHRSKEDFCATAGALDNMIERVHSKVGMTSAEECAFRRTIDRWVGSILVRKGAALPSPLSRALFLVLSPLMILNLRS